MAFRPDRQGAFLVTATLVFMTSAAATILWCAAMPATGGGTASWMRMCGPTGFEAVASFLGMWIVMMIAMMLPSLLPMLQRYRRAVGVPGATQLGRLSLLVAAGYFAVWAAIGVAVLALDAMLSAAATAWPALARGVPVAAAAVVPVAGALQFTAWKIRRLACCRQAPGHCHLVAANAGAAWRCGVRFGLRCGLCCGNLMAVLMVVGLMDLRAMAAATVAIAAERLAPSGEAVARAVGALLVGAGLVLTARAAGF